jgi:hypothetical protein
MRDETRSERAHRDPTAERQERDAFLVLFHLFNLSGSDPELEWAPDRLASDLAFERQYVSLLVDHLVMSGYVRSRAESGLHITPAGIEYVGAAARKRRSVRHQSRSKGAPGLSRWRGHSPLAQA